MMQPESALARRLNHDKPQWKNPVTGSGVSCQQCKWSSGEKVIAHIQTCILCHVNLCVKHFSLFHTSRTIIEGRQTIAPLCKYCLRNG